MIIIRDSREQKGYEYENMIVRKLSVGDYSVRDYEDEVCVERKAIGDAISSVMKGRERFEKEWKRALRLKRFFVVIEGTVSDIKAEMIDYSARNFTTFNSHKLKCVINTYIGWCVKYGVPVFFCSNREEAKRITYDLLRFYVKYADDGRIPLDEPELFKNTINWCPLWNIRLKRSDL